MTDHTPHARRGDRVTATLYHSENETVTGAYVPRDDHPKADPPADAAWVDTGDPQGPLMVNAATVERTEQEPAHRADLRAVRDAAQNLADTVRTALAHDLTGSARVQLPLLPRLVLPRLFPPVSAEPAEPEEPNMRHLAVAVRTVPVLGESTQEHVYRDDRGLTWQTYGQEHDFSTDRLLEVVNEDAEVVATYPPGTWLHARYVSYLDGTEATS
jgi:hypothetical protein